MSSHTGRRPLGWHRQFPKRWARERQAFKDRGWDYAIRYVKGGVEVHVKYPLSAEAGTEAKAARLQVVYPRHSYPLWMPVEVYDLHNELGVSRHRDPTRRGLLCLVHQEDHDPTWTAAELIATQLPKLIADNNSELDGTGLEVPGPALRVAEPVTAYSAAPARIVVPRLVVPDDVSGGALVVRQRVDRAGTIITGIVDQIMGPGLNIQSMNTDVLTSFPIVVTGWWLRLPSWDPNETASQLWRRIFPSLPPLEVTPGSGLLDFEFRLRDLAIIGLLVDDERTYGQTGQCWMFLVRVRLASSTEESPQYATVLLAGQELDNTAVARTPIASGLADKKVAVVGVGALGHHIATDLARTGASRLDLIDRDWVDVGTRARQWSPLTHAGVSKSSALAEHLRGSSVTSDIRGWDFNMTRLFELDEDLNDDAARRQVLRLLTEADLIIDASANPSVTAVLNAVAHGRTPLLTVAGTPGLWGGWVALVRPGATGCTECLIHYRIDEAAPDGSPWPVPPADPGGWVTPVGCSQSTFTGANSDISTVSSHASRVAIHFLAEGASLGGDYYVAVLRDSDGNPTPVAWLAVDLPVHPQCKNHSSEVGGMSAKDETSDG